MRGARYREHLGSQGALLAEQIDGVGLSRAETGARQIVGRRVRMWPLARDGLPGGSGDEGGDDVGGVAVE